MKVKQKRFKGESEGENRNWPKLEWKFRKKLKKNARIDTRPQD